MNSSSKISFKVLTLFPEIFDGFLSTSIMKRAISCDLLNVDIIQIRDYSTNKHKRVDGYPCGGGAGLVMAFQPLKDAVNSVKTDSSKVILMSPRGSTLTQKKCKLLSEQEDIILVCGRYEGIDQRFIDSYVDEELSIGDYILTGGEIAAMVVIDSVSRLREDVLGNSSSLEDESFTTNLLEYPQYTKPAEIDGHRVPDVLLSGNHSKIDEWRLLKAIEITKEKRPDLYEKFIKENEMLARKMLGDF